MKNTFKKICSSKYLIYTLLFLFISFFVFISFLISHKTFIWYEDGIWQHFIFLSNYLSKLKYGFEFFSFSTGLGQDIIGQYSYYAVGDPLVYLGLLFKQNNMHILYTLIIYLKFYLVGISFLLYAGYKKIDKEKSILGALLYTFTGFTLYAGIRHLAFLNPVIMFPLLLIGVEKLIKENKMSVLIITASSSFIINYYFAVTISIFACLYAIVLLLIDYKNDFKFIINRVVKAILCYLVAILISGIILFPTIYSFLNSARIGMFRLCFYDFNYYKSLLPALTTNALVRNRYWSVFGFSSIVVLFIPLLINHYKNHKKLFIYFILLSLILCIPIAGQVINGLSYPVNRWSFVYCFTLSIIVITFLNKNLDYTKNEKVLMGFSLIIYIIITLLLKNPKKEFLFMNMFAIIIYGIILLQNRLKKLRLSYFIYFFVFLNIISFSWFLYYDHNYVNEFVDNNDVYKNIETNTHTMDNLNNIVKEMKKDKSFYRTVIFPTKTSNISAYYSINTLAGYLSLGQKDEYQLSNDLNNSTVYGSRYIQDFDNRVKATSRLATKYYIVDKNNQHIVPYGYSRIYTNGNNELYKNNNYISPLIYTDDYITLEDYLELDDISKEQILLDTTVVENKNKDIKYADEDLNNLSNGINNVEYSIDPASNIIFDGSNIKVNNKNDKLILNITGIKNSEIYIDFNNIIRTTSGKHTKILKKLASTNTNNIYPFSVYVKRDNWVNDENRRSYYTNPYFFENRNMLMNLGYESNYDGKIEISFSKSGTYKVDSLNVYAIDMKNYEDSIKKIKQANISKYNNDYIEASISVENKGVMSLSTSYSKGWNVYVDNKKVNTFKVNNSMLGFYIDKGNHKIKLIYKTPYLTIGIISSIIGIVVLIFIIKKEDELNG